MENDREAIGLLTSKLARKVMDDILAVELLPSLSALYHRKGIDPQHPHDGLMRLFGDLGLDGTLEHRIGGYAQQFMGLRNMGNQGAKMSSGLFRRKLSGGL